MGCKTCMRSSIVQSDRGTKCGTRQDVSIGWLCILCTLGAELQGKRRSVLSSAVVAMLNHHTPTTTGQQVHRHGAHPLPILVSRKSRSVGQEGISCQTSTNAGNHTPYRRLLQEEVQTCSPRHLLTPVHRMAHPYPQATFCMHSLPRSCSLRMKV